MKLLLLCEIFSIVVLFSGCKNPPNVTACLIDVAKGVAHCSPVDKSKKAYDLQLPQGMDKFYCLSDSDFGTLLQWINNHDQ